MPYLGVRKLREKLFEQDGLKAGRKLIKRCVSEMGIYAVYPKPNFSKRNKEHKIYPYLLRNLEINKPNQVWAIDITYIKIGRNHMYMTAIIDWYSRFLVGFALSDTLDTAPVLEAVNTAIERYGKPEIINSDQGSQFTSAEAATRRATSWPFVNPVTPVSLLGVVTASMIGNVIAICHSRSVRYGTQRLPCLRIV